MSCESRRARQDASAQAKPSDPQPARSACAVCGLFVSFASGCFGCSKTITACESRLHSSLALVVPLFAVPRRRLLATTMAAAFEQILEDNTVRYQLYPRLKPAAGQQVADYLQQYIDESLGKLAKYLTGYIWQKEPFNLRVAEDAPYQSKQSRPSPA